MPSYFASFVHPDFAKSGTIPTEDLTLQPQPFPQFPVTMLNELRKLGMAVEIEDAVVILRWVTFLKIFRIRILQSLLCDMDREPFAVMTTGIPLTPEQARVLVKLDRPTISFRIKLVSLWTRKGCKFVEL